MSQRVADNAQGKLTYGTQNRHHVVKAQNCSLALCCNGRAGFSVRVNYKRTEYAIVDIFSLHPFVIFNCAEGAYLISTKYRKRFAALLFSK